MSKKNKKIHTVREKRDEFEYNFHIDDLFDEIRISSLHLK